MPENSCYNMVPVLRHLTAMLQPFAASYDIRLHFKNNRKQLLVGAGTGCVIPGISKLLYQIINYTSPHKEIMITLAKVKQKQASFTRIRIVNTGTNLSRITELERHLGFNLKASAGKHGTCFDIRLPALGSENPSEKTSPAPALPAFYNEIRKRLALQSAKADHLVATLSNFNPREAVFFRKVNALIAENITNPQLDANYISRALNMSRTQLFRRLKPIVRQSPGSYIKALKLQKAKELFETTDLRVNEVAFKIGFESPAHFSKSFMRHFGVKPSLFCKNKMQQMSK
jgi:AraC-like DNA-binding protein